MSNREPAYHQFLREFHDVTASETGPEAGEAFCETAQEMALWVYLPHLGILMDFLMTSSGKTTNFRVRDLALSFAQSDGP
ncbi:unnamed protein product [Haemonchus placei]|uniref:TFIID_NTD2 domain-containing protein n=1 Tax=Haemonchus placei TaxID=6290 RepID=A0A0N4WBI7_HAEPC|nr:unnamed protein product [Haemonchus placei]